MIEKPVVRSASSRFRLFSFLLAPAGLLSLLLSACGLFPMDESAYTTYVQEKIAAEIEAKADTGVSGIVCSAAADADGNLYFATWNMSAEKQYLYRWKDGTTSALKSFDSAVFNMMYVDGGIFFTCGQKLMSYDIPAGTVESIKNFGYDTNGLYRLGDYLVVDTLPPSKCVVHVFRISDRQETQTFEDSDRGAGWLYSESSGRAYRIGGMGRSLGYRTFDASAGTLSPGSVMGAPDADYFCSPWWLFPDGSRIVGDYGALFSTSTLKRSGNIGIDHIAGMQFEGGKAVVLADRVDLGWRGELEVIDAASPYPKLKSVRTFDYTPDALARQGDRFFVVLSDNFSNIFIYEYDLDELL